VTSIHIVDVHGVATLLSNRVHLSAPSRLRGLRTRPQRESMAS